MLTRMKRNVAVATLALGVAGGGAYAMAQTEAPRPTLDAATNAAVATLADTTATPPAATSPAAPSPGATSPAATSPGHPTGAGREASHAARRVRRVLRRRTVHVEMVVKNKDGQFVTIDGDRGTLSNVNGDVLKVDRPDAKQVTVKVDASTRYRGISGPDQLRTGDRIVVVSKDGTALLVAQRAPGAAPASPASPASPANPATPSTAPNAQG